MISAMTLESFLRKFALRSAAFAVLLGSSAFGAGVTEAVLDRNGDPAWAGAYLLDGPAESAKPLGTLQRATRVVVNLGREERGYLLVQTIGQTPAKNGWVHRKFLKFAGDAAVGANAAIGYPANAPKIQPPLTTVAQAARPAATPTSDRARVERLEELLHTLQKRLEASEAKNEELQKRIGTLEKSGGADPGVDFLQRLQKLEMEVHSRDSSSLPTVPFPEVPKHSDESKSGSAPARVPSMSWIFKGW